MVILAIGALAVIAILLMNQAPSNPGSTDNTGTGGTSGGTAGGLTSGAITNDPSTWPSGDNIWSICQAIAMAEGAETAGDRPDRNNNPGDISDGAGVSPNGSDGGLTIFPNKAAGWNALYAKVSNIVNGGSSTYPANYSIAQIGQVWAGGDANWAANVANQLGVDQNSTFGDYANG